MVQIDGTYELVKNENLAAYLQGYGFLEDKAKFAETLKPKLTVTIDGTSVTLVSDSDIEKRSTTFILNKEVEENMPMGEVVQSTATINGDTLVIKFKSAKGPSGTRTYKFTDTELEVTLVGDDGKILTAKLFYKRV